ncbi:cuticular protein RR-2 motif 90 precursor [Bombyx mori]|uniref:Putative cuticle protein n=1 Tax=Bombyx mori TaxID=7091 RepID=C0H6T2_BOMMO|nr:cuticular protein RR-2 motif 90 precursor [Bombyx mori]FAA00593.1 TPA: putative cuticle protein [Bombyx mori]
MIVNIFVAVFILGVSAINVVTGASFSKVFVQGGREVVPVEYLQYGAPSIAVAGSQLAQISAAPVGSVVPNLVAPCGTPCIYPGQSIAPATTNVVTYKSSVPVVVTNKEDAAGYEYSYLVYDENTGDHKTQHELSDGFNAVVKKFLPVNVEKKIEQHEKSHPDPPCHEVKNEQLKVETKTEHSESHHAPIVEEHHETKSEESSESSSEESHEEKPTENNHEEKESSESESTEESHEEKHSEEAHHEVVAEAPHEEHSEPLKELSTESHESSSEEHSAEEHHVEPSKHEALHDAPAHIEHVEETSHEEEKHETSPHDAEEHTHEHTETETHEHISINEAEHNAQPQYNDILKCVNAAINTAAGVAPQRSESPLTYIILNKPC